MLVIIKRILRPAKNDQAIIAAGIFRQRFAAIRVAPIYSGASLVKRLADEANRAIRVIVDDEYAQSRNYSPTFST